MDNACSICRWYYFLSNDAQKLDCVTCRAKLVGDLQSRNKDLENDNVTLKTQAADTDNRWHELLPATTDLLIKVRNLHTIVAKQESQLKFLRLQFSEELAGGGLKGDLVIVVQGRKEEPIYADKCILSRRSSVFCQMFNTKMLEGEAGTIRIRIDDATLPVMRAVVRFCYNAQIDFTDEVTAEEVLAASHKYAIDILQKLCEDHLATTINVGNLSKRLKLAKRYEATGL